MNRKKAKMLRSVADRFAFGLKLPPNQQAFIAGRAYTILKREYKKGVVLEDALKKLRK